MGGWTTSRLATGPEKLIRKKSVLFLFYAAFLIAISLFPAPGLAQSVDQLPVVDDAGIFGDRIGDVEAVASQLVSRGADVRVRTILTYGSAGNLDRYEEQLEQQSPSWLGPDGERKNNLIVLLIALQERQTGLYYGSVWDNILGNNWLRIQTDIMNPRFREGDYVGGTTAGLQEITRLIQTGGQPTPTTAPAATGFSPVLAVVLVIIFVAVGLLVFRSSRKSRARRLAARQRAMLAKQGAASGINELIERLQMLEIKVNVTAEKVVPDEAAELRDSLERAKRLINLCSQTYSELSHSAGDPENPRLGEAELGAIETEYQKVLAGLREAREEVKGVEDYVAVIQQAVSDFPVKVDEVNTAIAEASSKVEEVKKVGFKSTYPGELLAKAQATLKQAQEIAFRKRYMEGLKTVVLALDQAKQAFRAAEELPQKKQEAESAIPALATRIEQVKGVIDKGSDVFDGLVREYAESNWESIRGNGTEAENRINWSLDALDDGRAVASQQEWHRALELVGKADAWLTEAESLIKSISELEENLLAERRAAPGEIEAAQADVAKAWDYINRYDEDIRESLEDDLRAAEQKNQEAREELRKEKPDYFRAGKLAREANESADKILAQARDEHEAAERLRAKAASLRRDAAAKVSRASKYIEDHHPVVRNEARNQLNSAADALRQAESAADTSAQIALAERAESAADQAYALAQRDVNETSVNVPNMMPPIIFLPGGGPSRGGGWGSRRRSGSVFGGGSRGGGGGGSSGWGARGGGGGGGRGGGGSSGW